VNVLVRMLRSDPDLAGELADSRERLGLPELLDSPLGRAFPRDVRQRVARPWDEDGALLRDAFLATASADAWQEARRRATQRWAHSSTEWVAFAPGRWDDGVVLPDDAGRRPTVSLFAEVGRDVRRLAISEAPKRSAVRVSERRHCSAPWFEECDPGECGRCRLVELVFEGGLDCVCDC
jgi:hypothetical protein